MQSTGSRRTGFGSGDTRASVAPGRVGSSRTGDRARASALAGGFLPTAPPGTSLNVCSCPLPRLSSLGLVEAAAQLQRARAFSHAAGPLCPEPRMFRLTDTRVCQGSCCVWGSRPGKPATEAVWPVTPEKAPGGDWGVRQAVVWGDCLWVTQGTACRAKGTAGAKVWRRGKAWAVWFRGPGHLGGGSGCWKVEVSAT